MDHSLRSISYIADIGDLLVIMARRRIMPQDGEELQVIGSTPKMICHVFESEEVFRPFIPNKIRRSCPFIRNELHSARARANTQTYTKKLRLIDHRLGSIFGIAEKCCVEASYKYLPSTYHLSQ